MELPKSSSVLTQKLGINRYELVNILSKRARELMFGAKPLLETNGASFIDIAIEEVIAGKIKLKENKK